MGCWRTLPTAKKPLPDRTEINSSAACTLGLIAMSWLSSGCANLERQYGLILPGKIGNWIKAVYASADAAIEVMLFVFDADGNLRSSDAEAWDANAGGGFSVTLIFSVGSLTDTKRYEKSVREQLAWGMALTQPPLKTLNAQQNLATGANGIQLVGASTKVGQHTLELRD